LKWGTLCLHNHSPDQCSLLVLCPYTFSFDTEGRRRKERRRRERWYLYSSIDSGKTRFGEQSRLFLGLKDCEGEGEGNPTKEKNCDEL
jgi:hypothetical protein